MNNSNAIDRFQDELIDEFSLLEDWNEKYEFIIQSGKRLPPMDERHKTEKNRIHGCQSRVWIKAAVSDGRLHLMVDSDGLMTKGLASLLWRILHQQPLQDVARGDLYFFDRIGLFSHLSPSRQNGLVHMIRHIQSLAAKN